MGRKPGERLMRLLEGRAEVIAGVFTSSRGERLMGLLEGRAEAIAGEYTSQGVANTLWAYATMGVKPGERLMGLLEGWAEAIAGEFTSQEVANTLWAPSFLNTHNLDVTCHFFCALSCKLSVLDASCIEEQSLLQMHQFFNSCDLEEDLQHGCLTASWL